MSGTRMGIGRAIVLGVCLTLAMLLLSVAEAEGAKYNVAQCGWHLDADAAWADSTGGAKFRPDAWCATPAGADPFDGAHLKSLTKSATTVSGTRFARWRWVAPPGTGITRVSGTWWHALHDGMEQRLGVGTSGGGFSPFATASDTDTTPRNFVAGFSAPQPALEDRLLCARAESSWCNLERTSWSAVRALTITVQDDGRPSAGLGGDLAAAGWRRGSQRVSFSGSDGGSGVRFGETLLDGARVSLYEYSCSKALIGGEWRATRMRPCPTNGSGSATVATTSFSDGPHALAHCATDFAGNGACTASRTVLIDNNPPAHPRNLGLAGGEEWHRLNDFDLSWENPDQGQASPVAGAYWRIAGSAGFDTGVKLATGRDIASIADRTVPGPGIYAFHLWLRDEAGNAAPSSAVEVPLRFDDVPPGVAFEASADTSAHDLPDAVRAEFSDAHSGPASGTIGYRRLGTSHWIELPTRLRAVSGSDRADLVADLPDGLAAGTYLFRAEAVDAAGNTASSSRRADGTEMTLRNVPPSSTAGRLASEDRKGQAKTRLFAKLRWRRRHGSRVTVPFGAGARLSGRLVTADGAGLSNRRLRIVSRPSRGAVSPRRAYSVRTGPHGGFRLPLEAGPSRRIAVRFRGEAGLTAARRAGLALRVRGQATLHAGPRQLRNGGLLRLWGRVRTRGAALPRRGKLIAIQYYETEARRWRPVLVTRSDHSGRFRARYRFRYVSGTARIRLRAVALAEERWPYVPGASPSLIVSVTG